MNQSTIVPSRPSLFRATSFTKCRGGKLPFASQILVAVAITVSCQAMPVQAQTPWTNPGGGFWHTGSNWAGGSPPGPGGTAIFNLPNTYNVLWNNGFGDSVNAGLVVGAGNVTFSNTSASTRTYSVGGSSVITGIGTHLTVGSFPGNIMHLASGVLSIDSGGQVVATSGSQISTPDSLVVGIAGSGTVIAQSGGLINSAFGLIANGGTGSAGTVTVTGSGSQWNNANGLWVGRFGNGILNISAGGFVYGGVITIGGDVAGMSSPEGAVTVTGTGSQLDSSYLSAGESGHGTLHVAAGGVVNSLSNTQIGYHPGATGAVTVTGDGSQWNNLSSLVVGYNGAGTLDIEAGGLVTSIYGNVAGQVGSTGTATVTGSGSRWESDQILSVAYRATGTLNVQNGGVVTAVLGQIGVESDSNGFATVTGSGSQWNNAGELHVGRYGSGTLSVLAGGVVTNTIGFIGADSVLGTGAVAVNGSGSQWNSSHELYLERGTLNVENGGVVRSAGGILGFALTSNGIATVTGSGSRWENSAALSVGDGGTGTLNVTAGGVVTNTQGLVGNFFGSFGAATVTGSGSQWNNSSYLSVGYDHGYGTLNVENGGVVTSSEGLIGFVGGSTGIVTVTGSGSRWNNTNHLYVGTSGDGTLNVTAGGVVTNTVGSIAQNGSLSVATVTGCGSQWNNSNILVVGNNDGDGTLNVTAGGVVTNTQGFIANEGPSSGVVTVNGGGSRWINSSNLYVGHKGAGTLNIQSGGEVTNTNANIGLHVGSNGGATVTGAGSRWTNSEYLIVGSNGIGTLNALAGGAVTNTDAVIGFVPGSVGTALVTGTNSKWTNSGFLIVGNSGNGTLNVEAGGAVTNTDAVVGKDLGSTGTATVTGAGSQWTNSGFLAVGQSGNGTLTVAAGGVVTNIGWGFVGSEPGSVGVVTVTGSGSQWNNNDSLQVGRFGAGTLNIADGGTVSVVNLTAVDADGQINNSNGSFVSNTVINQPGGEILGQGEFSALGGWSNSGFMAFRGGVSHVYGPVNNLAGGRIFGEFFGTTIFHGDVVHNGAQIAVGQGSRIEFLGAVSGAGNYFSGGLVTMNGAFRPGNGPGVVSFARDLAFGAGSTTYMELAGVNPGEFDQVLVANTLSLAGTLEVSLLGGFVPVPGNSFTAMTYASRVGTFDSIVDTSLGGGLALIPIYQPTRLTLYVALPGDGNLDGAVNALDYPIWLAHYNQCGLLFTEGDYNGDGCATAADYNVWADHFGQSVASPGPGATASPVPEPAAILPAVLGMIALLLCRRRPVAAA